MQLWTTFCPQKVCWELAYRATHGDLPTSDWQKKKGLIRDSLETLRHYGISGIRLVIFPYDITDGESFDFSSVEYILELCQQIGLQVDFCLGPFQYPHYPGIRLPYTYTQRVKQSEAALDEDTFLNNFGHIFLKAQLQKFGNDPRIRGFYLGNEWPDRQGLEGRKDIQTVISRAFMQKAVSICKKLTEKPILFNTNIDASLTWRVQSVFKDFIGDLGKQVRLGFDVYPSQETWKNKWLQKLSPYAKAVSSLTQLLPRDQMLFTELEAQPWGGGRAWEYYLKQAPQPQEGVLTYRRESFPSTWERYVIPSRIQEVNLWGSDFWLVCYAAGITWPLEQVKKYSRS